jgi:hypothetical protein
MVSTIAVGIAAAPLTPLGGGLGQHSSGRFESVDEAADAAGYSEPFQYGQRYGAERVSGTLALSARHNRRRGAPAALRVARRWGAAFWRRPRR